MVVGPPGSGKTVVALYRARALHAQGRTVTLVMYNRVLTKYTGADLSETLYSWLTRWWRKCTRSKYPMNAEREWDHATALAEIRRQPDRFAQHGNWGHLIIDEAQDFPPQLHQLLWYVQTTVFSSDVDNNPSLMILADENQRLTRANSTIDEIRNAHMLPDGDVYRLTKNYRNTREIAQYAARFYVGLPSGIPELPTTRGDLPFVGDTENLDKAVDRIAAYSKLHEDHEVGVFVYYDNTRRKIYNKLAHRLQRSNIRVQTYGSREHEDAQHLRFEPTTITVLCFASCKGLEFDTVFLPELQTFPIDAQHRDLARMNLYVMCSRARRQLWLFVSEDSHRRADVRQLLPTEQNLFRSEHS